MTSHAKGYGMTATTQKRIMNFLVTMRLRETPVLIPNTMVKT